MGLGPQFLDGIHEHRPAEQESVTHSLGPIILSLIMEKPVERGHALH